MSRVYSSVRSLLSQSIRSVNPPLVYGPYVPHYPYPEKERLGSNGFLYTLFDGILGREPPKQIFPPYFCDVRDVAVAHVRALELAPTLDKRKKRFFISGGSFTVREAVEHLNRAWNILEFRLPYPGDAPTPGTEVALPTIDTSLASTELQLKEYITWKKCVNGAVDSLIEAEKDWSQ